MIKLNDSFYKKLENLKHLENYMIDVAKVATKSQALLFIRKFKSGIINNTLGLTPLKPITIVAKTRAGYSKPTVPLYGKGKQAEAGQSYYDMLRIGEISDGYAVWPANDEHWSGVMSLKDLFNIHEFGATIKKGTKLIRIPPRPAFKSTYQEYVNASVKKIVTEFVKKALKAGVKGNFTTAKRFKAMFPDWNSWDAT